MKLVQKLGTAIIVGILLLLFVYAQTTEFTYNINVSQLPFAIQETVTVTAPPNSTIVMAYDVWLSGENKIFMNNTNQTNLTIDVNIPLNTSVGNHTKYVFLASNNGIPQPTNITINFNIRNNTNQTNSSLVDLDGDGYYNDTDCNDNNASINPGAE